MTYAPASLRDLMRLWTAHGGTNLGIVGDTRHQAKGTSYHLGRSQLTSNAYSRITARDRRGLTEAASAVDLGRLDGTLADLRKFSTWLYQRCRENAPGTSAIREVIWSPDGKRVMRWDRERGYDSVAFQGEADNSHLTHTHVSFYRDTESADRTVAFRPYFELPDTATEDDMGLSLTTTDDERRGILRFEQATPAVDIGTGQPVTVSKGAIRHAHAFVRRTNPAGAGWIIGNPGDPLLFVGLSVSPALEQTWPTDTPDSFNDGVVAASQAALTARR